MLILILPQHQAKADLPGLGSMAIGGVASWIMNTIITGVGTAISWSAGLLDSFIGMTSFNPPSQVQDSWKMIRDFVNMFFILVLVIMAFGTIFDLQKYNYKTLLSSFLIAAIFVNFSYAIGIYIWNISNGLAHIFLSTIQGASNQSVSAILGNGLSLGHFVTWNGGNAVNISGISSTTSIGAGSPIITSVFFIVFLVMALMAILSAAIFAFIRIPFIWFFLIISPIAWLSYALPSMRSAGWSKWWKNFLGWCFFLPIYLFFLMFAVIFIHVKDSKITEIAKQQAFLAGPQAQYGNTMAGLFQAIGLNDIFFFVVTIIIMVYGLAMAKTVAFAGGSRAMKIFGGIENGVKRYFPGSRTARGIYAGAKQGYEARVERAKTEGVGFGRFRIGGESKLKGTIAEMGGFGERGAREKQFAAEVKKLKESMANIGDIERIRKMSQSGSAYQQLAAAEILRERNAMSGQEMIDTYKKYRENKAYVSATRFISSVDFKDLSGEERRAINANLNVTDLEAKRKIAKVMAEKGDFKAPLGTPDNMKVQAVADQITKAAELFATAGDRLDILQKAKKGNIEAAAIATVNLKIQDKDGNIIKTTDDAITKLFIDSIRKAKVDDMIDLSKETLANEEVKKIILDKLDRDFRTKNDFMNRATDKQKMALGLPTGQQPPQTFNVGEGISSNVERDGNPKVILASENNVIDLRNKSGDD